MKPFLFSRRVLAVAFCVFAVLPTVFAVEVNEGTVTYTGQDDAGPGPSGPYPTPGQSFAGYDNRGAVTAVGGNGGSGVGATALTVTAGGLTNSGTVQARGGAGGAGGTGVWIEAGGLTNSETGTINAIGDDGSGIIIQAGGLVNSGTVIATGGTTNSTNGIRIDSGVTNVNKGGTLTASGGAGQNANGVRVNGAEGVINSGVVTAFGGIGITSSGLYVRYALVNCETGTINAEGGDGQLADGVYVAGSAVQGMINSGTVNATGGTNRSAGMRIFSGLVNRETGTIHAVGGEDYSPGMFVSGTGELINSGAITAAGGSGPGSYGIWVETADLINKGVLTLLPGTGTDIAVTVTKSDKTVLFTAGSTLALGGGRINLLVHGAGGSNTLAVESGARLTMLGAAGLDVGEKLTFDNFVENDIASTTYENWNAVTATMKTTVTQNSGNLTAVFERIAYASRIASGSPSSYLAGMEAMLAGAVDPVTGSIDPLYAGYADLYSLVDSQPSAAAVRDVAGRLHRESTPQATANAVPAMASAARLAGDLFSSRLRLAGGLNGGAAGIRRRLANVDGNAYASLAPDCDAARLVMWASPFYQQGRLDGEYGYSDLKERIAGGAVGFASVRGPWVFGASLHYLNVDMDGGGSYDADADGYGVTLGVGRSFDLGVLTPWVELTGGYTYFDFDQTRHDATGFAGSYRADPDANLFSAGLLVSNEFRFGSFSFAPRLGLDYARTDMDGYTERGTGGGALDVSPEKYDSFRGRVGATLAFDAGCAVRFEVRGDYYREFADKQAALFARDASGLPFAFRTDGQNAGRDAGRLGAGVKWQASERTVVGLDYDLDFGRRYVGHRLAATLRVSF